MLRIDCITWNNLIGSLQPPGLRAEKGEPEPKGGRNPIRTTGRQVVALGLSSGCCQRAKLCSGAFLGLMISAVSTRSAGSSSSPSRCVLGSVSRWRRVGWKVGVEGLPVIATRLGDSGGVPAGAVGLAGSARCQGGCCSLCWVPAPHGGAQGLPCASLSTSATLPPGGSCTPHRPA